MNVNVCNKLTARLIGSRELSLSEYRTNYSDVLISFTLFFQTNYKIPWNRPGQFVPTSLPISWKSLYR